MCTIISYTYSPLRRKKKTTTTEQNKTRRNVHLFARFAFWTYSSLCSALLLYKNALNICIFRASHMSVNNAFVRLKHTYIKFEQKKNRTFREKNMKKINNYTQIDHFFMSAMIKWCRRHSTYKRIWITRICQIVLKANASKSVPVTFKRRKKNNNSR